MKIPISEFVKLINQLPDKTFFEIGYQFKIHYMEWESARVFPYPNIPEEGKKLYTELNFRIEENKAKEKEWHFTGIE